MFGIWPVVAIVGDGRLLTNRRSRIFGNQPSAGSCFSIVDHCFKKVNCLLAFPERFFVTFNMDYFCER